MQLSHTLLAAGDSYCGGLPRGLDRGRGVPLLGEEAQVVLLAAVLELRSPLAG